MKRIAEFRQVKRLGYHRLTPCLDRAHSFSHERPGCDRHDDDILSRRIALQYACRLPPVHVGQRQVHQNDSRKIAPSHRQALCRGGRLPYLKATKLQILREHFAAIIEIIDDQDVGRR